MVDDVRKKWSLFFQYKAVSSLVAMLKHSWLKPHYYVSIHKLITATDYILQQFGNQYSILVRARRVSTCQL